MNYTADDYRYMATLRVRALADIAKKLGKDHPVTQMLGSMAWGRSDWEEGPEGNLRTAVRHMSALDGVATVLRIWCRDHDREAQRIIIDSYPTRWQEAPWKRNTAQEEQP